MIKYDSHLSFDLSEDYDVKRSSDDEGNPVFQILHDKYLDEDGEEQYNYFVSVVTSSIEDSPFNTQEKESFLSLSGNIDNLVGLKSEKIELIMTIAVMTGMICLKKNGHVYKILSRYIGDDSITGNENRKWVNFLNRVISSVSIDGSKGDFEPLTAEKLEKVLIEVGEDNDDSIPVARPFEGQHTNLDIRLKMNQINSIMGGGINIVNREMELAFDGIEDFPYAEEDYSIIRKVANSSIQPFALSKTAYDMAELFRVDIDVFNPALDREQEIKEGFIQLASIYNTFRSFAWTLQAYCEKEGIKPIDLSFNLVEEIVEFISDRKGLNYQADSFSPTICSGNDINNFYVPDSLDERTKNQLSELISSESHTNCVFSLNKLREELEYMYPVINEIYFQLKETRDREEPLEGGIADILYAWCTITYAAREPICQTDGTMSCMWEHPDNMAKWGNSEYANKGTPNIERLKKHTNSSKEQKKDELPLSFTYNQHLKAEGEGYVIEIPDGFMIKKGFEGRDFVAYIPNKNNPNDVYASEFILFAGQKQENSAISQLKTVYEYSALIDAMSSVLDLFDNSKSETYNRNDLPAGFVHSIDSGCMHVNVYIGIDDYLQAMRFQIQGVKRKNRDGYVRLIKELLDHMTALKPAQLLKELDAPEFGEMELDGSKAKEWVDCVNDYVQHLSSVRAIRQNSIVSVFQSSFSNKDINKLKKDLKNMLKTVSQNVEEELRKAEYIYTLKSVQYPNARILKDMKQAVLKLAELAKQEVNLEGKPIVIRSDYAEMVIQELDQEVTGIIDRRTVRNYISDYNGNNQSTPTPPVNKVEETIPEEVIEKEIEKESAVRKVQEEQMQRLEQKLCIQPEKEELLRKKYEKEHAVWEQTCDEINKRRQDEIEHRCVETRKKQEADLKEKYYSTINTINETKGGYLKNRTAAQNSLEQLGLLSFSKKKALKDIIEEMNRLIEDADQQCSVALEKYKLGKRRLQYRYNENKMKSEITSQVNAELQYPIEPSKPYGYDRMYDSLKIYKLSNRIADSSNVEDKDYETINEVIQNHSYYIFKPGKYDNNDEYKLQFQIVKCILMVGQRKDIHSMEEMSSLLKIDPTEFIIHFMDLALVVLWYWQYDDVKYYDNFMDAVLRQFDDINNIWGIRLKLDAADLYMEHGDVNKGNSIYEWLLKETIVNDYIYYRYAVICSKINSFKAKSIIKKALETIDERYPYYNEIKELSESKKL